MSKKTLIPTIQNLIDTFDFDSIPEERKKILKELIDYINNKLQSKDKVLLNFICTHNSRRSQLSQLWAKVASFYYSIEIESFSGGVEVTAFNERAVASLSRFGFKVEKEGSDNPLYKISFSQDAKPVRAFSKVYDDSENPETNFAAIMTCSHADENCPFIPGAEQRIPIRYKDPKAFDDTPEEASKYDERSLQIATEMFYVFKSVNHSL